MVNLSMEMVGTAALAAGFGNFATLQREPEKARIAGTGDAGRQFLIKELATAIAIAKGESGLNPQARNGNTNGSVDYGLWQINTVHRGRGGSFAELHDGGRWDEPGVNARMAYEVYKNNADGRYDWRPWVIYDRRLHLPHMTQATQVARLLVAGIGTEPGGLREGVGNAADSAADAVDGVLDPIQEVLQLVRGMKEWFDLVSQLFTFVANPANWKRVGLILAGSALMLIAIVQIIRGTKTGRMVEKTAVRTTAAVITKGKSEAAGIGDAIQKSGKPTPKPKPEGGVTT